MVFIVVIGGTSDIKILWLINKLTDKTNSENIYTKTDELFRFRDNITWHWIFNAAINIRQWKNMQFSIETIKRLSNEKITHKFYDREKITLFTSKSKLEETAFKAN